MSTLLANFEGWLEGLSTVKTNDGKPPRLGENGRAVYLGYVAAIRKLQMPSTINGLHPNRDLVTTTPRK